MNRSLRQLLRLSVVVVTAAVAPTVITASALAGSPVDEAEAEVARVVDELERLEQESDILAEDYVTAIDEKNQLDAEVADAERRVAETEAQVGTLRGELSEVAVRAFTTSGTDSLGPMFSDSSQYTDGLQRDQLSRVALSTGTATTDELDEAVVGLQEDQDELDNLREAAVEKAAEVEGAKAANEERHTEYEAARAEAEANLAAEIQAEEERRARESYERMQREAEAAAAEALAQQQAAAAEAQQQAVVAEAEAQEQAAPQAAAEADAPSSSSSSSSPSSSSSSSSATSSNNAAPVNAIAAPAPRNPEPAPEAEPEAEPESRSYPAASSRAGTAVNAAMSQLGVSYRFAAAEPGVAFDCSGLTSWAWGQAGVYLPHQSRQQYASLPHVPTDAAQPGDLIFFYDPISHVSIYLGGGQQVHAPNSGTVVNVANVNWGRVVGVGRPG